MKSSSLWLVVGAVVAALIVIGGGLLVMNPSRPLVESAGFSAERITPNADGQDDVVIFSYSLSQAAQIDLIFEDETGREFVFRDDASRVADDYQVQFSGVVDGFRLPDETWQGDLQTRLLPDGLYTWTLTATTDAGDTATESGTLEIVAGDATLPIMRSFEVHPPAFTPNQDGIRDRVSVNIFLEKPAQLTVYLEDAQGVQIYLAARKGQREPGEEGNFEYDYDGGVDQGFRPPADGAYTIFAIAQDDEGQRMVRTAEIEIAQSGLPQVEILPQTAGATVCFEGGSYEERYFSDIDAMGDAVAAPQDICSDLNTLTLPVGDMLVFQLTVRNYGDTPVRTAGPFPGAVYSFDQRASTLGEYEESGAWRVGIDCETAQSDYPWRWALADPSELTEVIDENGETYYYLQPGQRAVVWGAVRMTEIIDARNPQPCWAGLIHEDVGIPPLQNGVGRREVELVPVQ